MICEGVGHHFDVLQQLDGRPENNPLLHPGWRQTYLYVTGDV